jgi:hypothetical protein
MLSLRKPGRAVIDGCLEVQRRRDLNYADVCGTRGATPPRGYNIDRNRSLKALGIRPVRIWEHNLGKDLTLARRQVRRAVAAGSPPVISQ